jgi:hypothetical protein
LDNGAWQLRGGFVHRGLLFTCLGPITNAAVPLIFENLTMDGNVQQGRQPWNGPGGITWPARTNDGWGADVTHDAVVDASPVFLAPMNAVKRFINCRFAHFRGEILKSVVAGVDGYVEVTNCSFIDGNLSGFNFNFTHRISGCLFSNMDMAMEFYEGYMQGPSVFENSIVTNTRDGIVINGSLSNHITPSYTIRGNSISAADYAVLICPSRNLTVAGNQFFDSSAALATDGAAYQGTDFNYGINVLSNTFHNCYYGIAVGGNGPERIQNMVVISNTAWNCFSFGTGYGWSSNVFFAGNVSSNPGAGGGNLASTRMTGQWFLDDPSNDFPPNTIADNVGQTNIISYASGLRQLLWVPKANSVFLIDDTSPLQIPPGAQLRITNTGPSSAKVFFSRTNPSAPSVILPISSVLYCLWTNGNWTSVPGLQPGLGQQPIGLRPPTGVRFLQPDAANHQ